jgi:hypothetical protein
MTINVTRIVSPDLFAENESIVFSRLRALQLLSTVPPLGAVTFVAAKSEASADLEKLATACGNDAIALIMNASHENYRVWLFVSERFEIPWTQNENSKQLRFTRYRKLWHKHLDLIASGRRLKSWEGVTIESKACVHFAGLFEVPSSLYSNAINAVRTNPTFSIIVSKRPNMGSAKSVRSIFGSALGSKDGNDHTRVDWLALAVNVCAEGDILVRVSGLFDDHEAAVDIIATKDVIVAIARA